MANITANTCTDDKSTIKSTTKIEGINIGIKNFCQIFIFNKKSKSITTKEKKKRKSKSKLPFIGMHMNRTEPI